MRIRVLICLVAAAAVVAMPSAPSAADAAAVIGRGAEPLTNGHWRVTLGDGTVLQTHGPDPAAPDHGGGLGPGDPERAPLCALDFHQHILYGRLRGSIDRFETAQHSIRASVRRMNALLNEESLASGDREADYKVKCDPAGEMQVDSFVAEAADFNSVSTGARAAGFVAPNADYTIFFDGNFPGVCGIASLFGDERVEPNLNNLGGGYAVTYRNCWNGATPMHENGHNQGATQARAPYSTGSGHHCYDENDVMCYSPDGGDSNQRGTFQRCADRLYFDCGHDTYFDSAPEAGEYLASNWNLGSPVNRFIAFGPKIARPPVAALEVSCSDRACSFYDRSTDGGALSWHWDFGDGVTSNAQHPAHAYAADGTYTVTLTVTDDDQMMSSTSRALVVPDPGDPDPATPNLVNQVPSQGENGLPGSWQFYKIRMTHARPGITFTLLGQPCVGSFCHPNLDLFVRFGARPTLEDFDCFSSGQRDDEWCDLEGQAGTWYAGVYTRDTVLSQIFGPQQAGYAITAMF